MKIGAAILVLWGTAAHADDLTPVAAQGPWKSVRDWCASRPARSEDHHCGRSHDQNVDGDLKLEHPAVQLVIETEHTDGPRFNTTDVGVWLAVKAAQQLWFSPAPLFTLRESDGWRYDSASGAVAGGARRAGRGQLEAQGR